MRWFLFSIAFTACADNAKVTITEPSFEEDTPTDADGDGYLNVEDCDDTNAAINPGTQEICDGIDNDCDDEIDEDVTTTFFIDSDGDGFGDPEQPNALCEAGDGMVPNDHDCDDNNALIFPSATEICDGIDNDCDDEIDEEASTWAIDYDGDGYGASNITVTACTQPEGYVDNTDDCDDLSSEIYPGAVEICDEIDNDCDDAIDDEDNSIVYDQTADKWFTDQDNDGYGDQTSGYLSCSGQQGSVRDNTDCNDADSTINPDTFWYADSDGDGYGAVPIRSTILHTTCRICQLIYRLQ